MRLVSNYVKQYVNHIIRQGTLSLNTVESYRNDLLRFVYWLKGHRILHLEQINQFTIIHYVNWLRKTGNSPRTTLRFLSSIKQFYEYSYKARVITVDPTALLPSFQFLRQVPLVLSQREVKQLLSAPNQHQTYGLRNRAVFELMYAAGLRASEVIRLTVTDLRPELHLVRVPGKLSRIVPVDSTALKWLKRYLHQARPQLLKTIPCPYLFLNRNGKPITRQGLWQNLKRYVRVLGIRGNVTLSTLRNTFTYQLLVNGADQRAIKKLLGYSSDSMINLLVKGYSINNHKKV